MITFVLIILGTQTRPATPPEVKYDNTMPPPAATLPTIGPPNPVQLCVTLITLLDYTYSII